MDEASALAIAHGVLDVLSTFAKDMGDGNAESILASVERQLGQLPIVFHGVILSPESLAAGAARAKALLTQKQAVEDDQARHFGTFAPAVVNTTANIAPPLVVTVEPQVGDA